MKDIASVETKQAPAGPTEQPDSGRRASKLDCLPLQLLRCTDVQRRTGLSRATISRLERRGAFPKHIKISANIVAWLEEDILEWVRRRAEPEPLASE